MRHLIITTLVVLLTAVNAMASQPSPSPDQIHLTWTGDPATTVTIQWRTDLSVTDSMVDYGPTDAYGSSAAGVSFTLAGKTVTNNSYTEEVMHHVVALQGLSPSTTYHYQAGGGGRMSADYYFTTAPVTGAAGADFTFAVFGDSRGLTSGVNPSLSTFVRTIANRHPAFVIFTGDATFAGLIDEWDDWFTAMSSISPYIAIMPVDGNHEEMGAGGTIPVFYGEFAVPFANGRTWQDPWQNWSTKGFYYSFDYGNAHFTVADDEYIFGAPVQTDEVTWLNTDLQSPRAAQAKWRFVANHMPEFAGGSYGSDPILDQYWVPVFVNDNVNMVFNGHTHFYERTFPLDKSGNPVQQNAGVTYVIAGSIGADLYTPESRPFIAAGEETYNYTITNVAGDTITMNAYRVNDQGLPNYDTLIETLSYTNASSSGTSSSSGCACNTTDKDVDPFDTAVFIIMVVAVMALLRRINENSNR